MIGSEEEVFRETSEEGRWLSYDELGQIRGIGRPSAVKLAQRERWQRRSGNDRTARVLVPLDWLKPAKRQPETSFREGFRDEFPEFSHLVSVLEGELAEKGRVVAVLEVAVATLREQLDQANARAEAELRRIDQAEQATGIERDRADRAEDRADRAEQGRERAEQAIEAERGRTDGLRDRLNAMQAQLADAHAALQAAEAADARAARAGGQATELRERIDAVQVEAATLRATLAAAEADAKAANERAWASGEVIGALREQLAGSDQRIATERNRADRAESRAAREHEDLLDAEGRARWAEEGREAEHERADNLQAERILIEERAGRAENQVFEMQAQVAAAQAAAEEAGRKAEEARRAAQAILEEDTARRRLGLLARLGRALRGE